MATALELVNRVRRKLRWGDTNAFAADVDKALLDEVNAAVAVIFETWDWDCDKRHDGVLMTFPKADVTGRSTSSTGVVGPQIVSSGTTDYTTALDAIAARAVMRAVVTTDTEFGDTAFRVVYAVGTTLLSQSFLVLDSAGLATISSAASVSYFANEYALPDTVRKVASVRHQESEVRLEEMERCQMIDRMIQRPHEVVSDEPEIVAIGGSTLITSDGGTPSLFTATPDYDEVRGLGFWIYPTPESELRLDYSYYAKHADMTATTDTLGNVDRVLEDFVVELAYARAVTNYVGDADPGAGLAIEQRAMNLAQRYYMNQTKDPARRRVLGSNFSDQYRGVPFGRFPRNFGTGT